MKIIWWKWNEIIIVSHNTKIFFNEPACIKKKKLKQKKCNSCTWNELLKFLPIDICVYVCGFHFILIINMNDSRTKKVCHTQFHIVFQSYALLIWLLQSLCVCMCVCVCLLGMLVCLFVCSFCMYVCVCFASWHSTFILFYIYMCMCDACTYIFVW